MLVVGTAATGEHATAIREVLRHPEITPVDLHRNPDGSVEYGALAPIGLSGAPPLGVAYVAWRADRAIDPTVESWPVPTRTAETFLRGMMAPTSAS